MHISICQKDKKVVLTLNIENANLYRSEILIEKSETICLQIILPRLLTLMIDSLLLTFVEPLVYVFNDFLSIKKPVFFAYLLFMAIIVRLLENS